MSETYCGKSCESCVFRERLECAGCKNGPAREGAGECKIAICCRSKGKEKCSECGGEATCSTWRVRGTLPEYRLRIQEATNEEIEIVLEKAPLLERRIGVLLVVGLIGCVGIIPTIAGMFLQSSYLYTAGRILSLAASLAYAITLFCLSPFNYHYGVASVCNLIAFVSNVVMNLLTGLGDGDIGEGGFMLLAVGVLQMVGVYQEYTAHADIACDADAKLGRKWEWLWKIKIGIQMYSVLGGGILAIVISPVGAIVTTTLKYLYLFETKKSFKEYYLSKGTPS